MSKNKRDKKISTFGLKLISVIVSFVIWIGVYNMSDAITSDTKNIKINTKNEDIMSDMKLSYDLSGMDNVKVRYRIRSNERGKITSNDFDVYIDFSEYTVTEAFPIHCNILNNKDDLIYDISLEPSILKLDTEKIQKKTFKIESITNGEPRTNYSIGSITLGDTEVEIEGPQSELGRINKVGIELDIDDIHENRDGRLRLTYFDSNNNKLNLSSKMKTSIENTKYYIGMLYRKNVELRANVVGEPIENVYYKSHTIEPRDITIEGSIEALGLIESINLGDIDITGKTGDVSYNIDVTDRLPEGVNLIGDNIVKIDVSFLTIEPETVPETSESTEEGIEEGLEESLEASNSEESLENLDENTIESSENLESDFSNGSIEGPGSENLGELENLDDSLIN